MPIRTRRDEEEDRERMATEGDSERVSVNLPPDGSAVDPIDWAQMERTLRELSDAADDERDAASRVATLEQEAEEAGATREQIENAIGTRA